MMNMQFSIIIPVYNRADCILRCLESVVNQDFDSYEIIVVNDGSTDNTLLEIYSFHANFTNLEIINYPVNKGVNFARNRGIEKAKGRYIIFLDSDDILTSNALENIEKNINLYPGYSHFLFMVSDRMHDKSLPNKIKEYRFEDWLIEKVKGDFVHVIVPECFNELMFVEEFRIYESLNWLRVLRQNQKQLYIPIIVTERERDRSDSVTRETILNNKISILNNYNYIHQFVTWYSDDFYRLNLLNNLQPKIKKGILLGIASSQTLRNIELIERLKVSVIEKRLFKFINKRILSFLFYKLIQIKSSYNHF